MLSSHLFLVASALFAFPFFVAFYRLYLHPLAKFKGPRGAALSYLWLHLKTLKGQPEETFEALHQEYNTTALRIGPNELHITDPEAYNKIYSRSTVFPKDRRVYDSFLIPFTTFGSIDLEAHRARRKLLTPLFSKPTVANAEPLIMDHVEKFFDKACSLTKRGLEVNLDDAFRTVTIDIISEYCFGNTTGLVEKEPEKFWTPYLDTVDAANLGVVQLFYNPFRVLYELMPQILFKLNSNFSGVLDRLEFGEKSWAEYQKGAGSTHDHQVVFDHLEELPKEVQLEEASSLINAGGDTTAYTLTVGVTRILKDSSIHDKLVEELKNQIPNMAEMPNLDDLARFNYLQACIKESLRCAMPTPGRLPRIVPSSSTLVVEDKLVPPGTTVGMSAYSMHRNIEKWGSDFDSFRPERWLESEGKHLESFLVAFGKGPRQCIGMNLANAELTLILAHLFRRYQMTLKLADVHTRDVFVNQLVKSKVLVDFKPLEQ